ncbi:hypothetical protein [Fluviicola sp.]|uniref:hypothetical protein n=1 Tax=Fluviicola sp. TaxID=1917219 RepID=UPI0026295451|nr:hypothetical protein [Fluviicola sp.]
MKKLLFICALTAALFSCKKEKLFKGNSGSTRGLSSAAISPAEQTDRTVLVVLISTPTKQNMRTEQEAREAVFSNTGRSLRTFYNETSGGRLFIAGLKDRLLGDVVSINVLDLGILNECATDTWKTLALPALLAKLIVPSQYNTVIYITPLVSGCSNGIGTTGTPGGTNTGYSVVYFDKDGSIPIRQRTLAHEVGHNLGLSHANTRTCTDNTGLATALSDNFTVNDQKDPNEVMGTSARGEEYGRLLCAPRLQSLGWLSSSEIITTTSTGTFTLSPLYGGGTGSKALVVPAFIAGYDLWIETRQPFGIHDDFNAAATFQGVSESAVSTLAFRLVKKDASNRVSTELLDMHPSTVGYWGFIDAYLRVGETFTYGGKSFKLESVASDGSATLKITGPPPATLIAYGATWRFLDNGSNQGTSWIPGSFNDAAWASGASQLGYGDGDEATVVGYGPNILNRYVTTYFRKTITITNPAAYASFVGNVKRDDGVAIYINGTEVYRNNLAAGASYTTYASLANDDGDTPQNFSIPSSVFVAGNNIIAVEMHQASGTSSDLSFDLELKGN